MTVQELINELEKYDPYLEVNIMQTTDFAFQIDSCYEDLNEDAENVVFIKAGQLA